MSLPDKCQTETKYLDLSSFPSVQGSVHKSHFHHIIPTDSHMPLCSPDSDRLLSAILSPPDHLPSSSDKSAPAEVMHLHCRPPAAMHDLHNRAHWYNFFDQKLPARVSTDTQQNLPADTAVSRPLSDRQLQALSTE